MTSNMSDADRRVKLIGVLKHAFLPYMVTTPAGYSSVAEEIESLFRDDAAADTRKPCLFGASVPCDEIRGYDTGTMCPNCREWFAAIDAAVAAVGGKANG